MFGNEFLDQDKMAKEIMEEISLPGIAFVSCLSPNDLTKDGEKKPVILDVVANINKVMLIPSVDRLEEQQSVSPHDMDLGFHLLLFKQLGMIDDATIIGVPMYGNKQEIIKEVMALLVRLTTSL